MFTWAHNFCFIHAEVQSNIYKKGLLSTRPRCEIIIRGKKSLRQTWFDHKNKVYFYTHPEHLEGTLKGTERKIYSKFFWSFNAIWRAVRHFLENSNYRSDRKEHLVWTQLEKCKHNTGAAESCLWTLNSLFILWTIPWYSTHYLSFHRYFFLLNLLSFFLLFYGEEPLSDVQTYYSQNLSLLMAINKKLYNTWEITEPLKGQ